MSKLNLAPKSNIGVRNSNGRGTGESYNGNVQSFKSYQQELLELLSMTMYGNDSYYESTSDIVERLSKTINNLVAQDQFDFIANTIVFARKEMLMRSFPIVATVMFIKSVRALGKRDKVPYLRRLVTDVIQRADQITDMYAYALSVWGNKKDIPMVIKRGVADAMNKFNEYHFAKYNRKKTVTFKDVLRITHPRPKDLVQSVIFNKIINDSLETPYTWETELSRNGQLPEDERKPEWQLWSELILSDKMGYMALLRNARNILHALTYAPDDVVQPTVKHWTQIISDPQRVATSKQLPFRFSTAINMLKQAGGLNVSIQTAFIDAISDALELSVNNVPSIGEHVWIIVDASGSMTWRNGKTSSPFDTAAILAAALYKRTNGHNVAVTLFSNYAENVRLSRKDSIITNVELLRKKAWGYGTNLKSALDLKPSLGFDPETVIVLSDMQIDKLRGTSINRIFQPECTKIAINLNSYSTTCIPDNKGWIQLSGWSDTLFDFINTQKQLNHDVQPMISKLETSYPYFEHQ